MTRFFRIIPASCVLLASVATAQINHARVITTDFKTIQGEIITLNQDGLTLINNQGITARVNWDSAWGMTVMMNTDTKRLIRKVQDENALVFVDTVDGQRIFMTLIDSDDPDFILGSMGTTRVKINLEHIQSVWRVKQRENRDPLATATTASDSDRIKLTNGDDLTGFVLNIGSTTTIETDAGIVSVPLYQTQSIQLTNPATPRDFPGLYIHTDLGLTYHTSQFTLEPKTGKLSMTLVPGIIEYEPRSEPVLDNSDYYWPNFDLKLAAVEIRHKDRWISDPLKDGAITYKPTGGRAWTPKPSTYNLTINTLDAGSIRFHAPTRLETEIDPRSIRLRCEVRPVHLPWTNYIATIEAIDVNEKHSVIWTQHLTGSSDKALVDVAIPANTHKLAFIIDPGINGPIQDAGHFAMIRLLVKD